MRAAASPRLTSFALIAVGGALAALVLGRPAIAALVVPFALAAAVGIAGARAPGLRVGATIASARVLEGDSVVLDVRVHADAPVGWLELLPTLPHGLEATDPALPLTIALDGGTERRIAISVAARAWGAYQVGEVIARARGPLGVLVREGVHPEEADLRVLPSRERLRRLVGPARA